MTVHPVSLRRLPWERQAPPKAAADLLPPSTRGIRIGTPMLPYVTYVCV